MIEGENVMEKNRLETYGVPKEQVRKSFVTLNTRNFKLRKQHLNKDTEKTKQ